MKKQGKTEINTEKTDSSYYVFEIDTKCKMKPFLTFEEIKKKLLQPNVISSTKVYIKTCDIEFAKQFFRLHNYYSFSIYKKCLPNRTIKYFDFNDCIRVFKFDSFLRNQLQKFTGDVENLIKVSIINSLCSNYQGSLQTGECYLDKSIYCSQKEYKTVVKMFGKRAYQSKKSLSIKHHIDKKNVHIPLWVIIPELTFGETTFFINSLKKENRNKWLTDLFLSNEYYYKEEHMAEHIISTATSWINASWHIRNRSAHYGRLYALNFNIAPPSFYTPTLRSMKNIKKKSDNRDLFAYMIAIKQILICHDSEIKEEWNKFIDKIYLKISASDVINLYKMGFPEKFKDYLLIPDGKS